MNTVPFEYLAYKTQIQVIYLHPNGQTSSGLIHVNGKSVCQFRHCFLCKEVLCHFRCYQTIIQFAIYSAFFILIVLTLASLKFVIKTFLYVLKSILLCSYALLRITKAYHMLLFTFRNLFRIFVQRTYTTWSSNTRKACCPQSWHKCSTISNGSITVYHHYFSSELQHAINHKIKPTHLWNSPWWHKIVQHFHDGRNFSANNISRKLPIVYRFYQAKYKKTGSILEPKPQKAENFQVSPSVLQVV